jgi:hypothetical protein
LREDVAVDVLRGFVKAHLLVRRTKPLRADAGTGFASRADSEAVFGFRSAARSFFDIVLILKINSNNVLPPLDMRMNMSKREGMD